MGIPHTLSSKHYLIASTFNKCVVDYLELNLGEEAGRAVELKA